MEFFSKLSKYQKWGILSVVLLIVSFTIIIPIFFFFRSERTYSEEKYAIVIEPLGAMLRPEPNIHNERLAILKFNTVLRVSGETKNEDFVPNVGKSKWYFVKTISNQTGYVFGKLIRFIPKDVAEREIRRDRSNFEMRLKKMAWEAASNLVKHSDRWRWDCVDDLHIVTPLEPTSSNTYELSVDVRLHGCYLAIDKFTAHTIVNMNIELDQNMLNGSEVTINHTDIAGEERVEGIDPGQAVNLLAKVLP